MASFSFLRLSRAARFCQQLVELELPALKDLKP
jgi:hypothetical protein